MHNLGMVVADDGVISFVNLCVGVIAQCLELYDTCVFLRVICVC